MSPTAIIILTASLVASSCALIGTFLVLRRMALLGDAISHAVLPGIVLAFLLTQDRSPLPMVIGAGIFGVLTVFLVALFNRTKRLKEDASIGVVFPALFSFGVILIAKYAYSVDLDLDCVLYGEIAYTPWDVFYWGERSLGARALWINAGTLLLNLTFIGLFFKELKLSTFDTGLCAALGFSPVLLHYLLMSAVSVTVVGAFESVGAILVVAMLIVPPAAAYLFSDRLGGMLILSVVFGIFTAVAGYYLARWWDASIAGAMATTAGLVFLLSLLFSPRYGVLAREFKRKRLTEAMHQQLLLLHLSQKGDGLSRELVAQRFGWSHRLMKKTASKLEAQGWIRCSDNLFTLEEAGAEALRKRGHEVLRHPLAEEVS